MIERGMSAALPLALRGLRRDWRAGELGVLVAALVIAVGAITAVEFFTDRMRGAMERKAAELLAADLALESSAPLDPVLAGAARALDLDTALTVEFPSVLVAEERFQLASLKAVTEGYPLRGVLRIAPAPFAPDATAQRVPSPGTVWPDSRLVSLLGLEVGDRLAVGDAELKVDAVLTYEPDRGGDLFSLAPRLLMNHADLPATRLVQPGSRVRYALLLAGPPERLASYREEAAPLLDANEQFQGVKDARPEMRAAIERAEQFLGLAALVSVLLAGAAIAVASRRFAERRLDTAAIMRCLGAAQALVVKVFFLQVLAVGLAASALGCVLGYAGQNVLVAVFEGLLLGELPGASLRPIGYGLAVGVIALVGFALPPLLRLRHVPPSRVLRRDLGRVPSQAVLTYACALGTAAGLILWHAEDATLAGYVLGGGLASLVVLSACALALVRALGTLRDRVGTAWRFGLANIARRPASSTVQVVAFGLGIMVLLLLTLVRQDLLADWRASLPADTPNYFLINVQPEEVEDLRAFLREAGVEAAELYPMVRGRLRAIDGEPVSGEDYDDPRARRLATREFNLSFAAALKPDNRIVAGRWWEGRSPEPPELSVEAGIAETLGIDLGDTLTYRVAGEEFSARVTSLRAVEWDSFKVNFFVVASPGLLEPYPATYITSFFLPPAERELLSALVRAFPSVTVLDVEALLAKVREIMEQAVVGVEYVFLFTLLAGAAVLFAATQSTMDERRLETAIVRALGGRRSGLMRGLVAEFLALGVVAGLLAALAASVVGEVLAIQVFRLHYRPDPWLWLIGVLGGGLGVCAAGLIGARSALDSSPLATLRSL